MVHMSVFITLLIAHIQAHHFVNVTSGVDGVVIEQTVSRQESPATTPKVTASKIVSKNGSQKTSKDVTSVIVLPNESPIPIQKRPVYVGDKFCGIPWPDAIERYNKCMASPERKAYMAH